MAETVLNPDKIIVEGLRTVATSQTLAVEDFIVLASDDITLTLPGVETSRGAHYIIKKTDTDGTTVTITPTDGTIDGETGATLTEQYSGIEIVCDGTNWHKVGTIG